MQQMRFHCEKDTTELNALLEKGLKSGKKSANELVTNVPMTKSKYPAHQKRKRLHGVICLSIYVGIFLLHSDPKVFQSRLCGCPLVNACCYTCRLRRL